MDQTKTGPEPINFVISQEFVGALMEYMRKKPIEEALGFYLALQRLPRVTGLMSEDEYKNKKRLTVVEKPSEE